MKFSLLTETSEKAKVINAPWLLYDLPPNPMLPQPVIQVSTPSLKVLSEAARHTGTMKSLKVTGEESFRREMSLSLVLGL